MDWLVSHNFNVSARIIGCSPLHILISGRPKRNVLAAPSTFLEYPSQREAKSDQLCFISSWDMDKTYDEHPPIYLHYLIDWKVKLNNRTVTKVTEPDVVLAPGAYWQKVLKKVERVKAEKYLVTDALGWRILQSWLLY
ncbi:hypothetical protein TSTA_105680 [Talaromyces stipitatus ATCC 10500]|uniref:Uncharacterized protein n=1 Tax=Talaromyces stipitatus (strain ATCC 10500 / CBS 375.48 / QM 6759 / NRRL 1006) TaxID=441959 RepID=B8MPB8_TALSN|nr:uncharacterized protein TSTA_105680 [Talaromyces stipitatus ATCC 10500]EED14357.1 hypothetical protein TSTA_105680 [Talaromyces stipitatus ATCC 10500]